MNLLAHWKFRILLDGRGDLSGLLRGLGFRVDMLP